RAFGGRARGGGKLGPEPRHVLGVGAELGIAWTDAGLEPHPHQNRERRAARPCAIISAMRSFTRSTLSAITSSSSFGLPSNSIGSPKWMWYLTGSGRRPGGPSHRHLNVTG